jgi:hypothetical protein
MPSPRSNPTDPNITYYKGKAEGLEMSYNKLVFDYNKLESELDAVTTKKDAIIYAMKARQGFWIGIAVASVVFGIISLVIRWR